MSIETRIRKIEKAIEEIKAPEDELQKIFEYEKAKNHIAYGPRPEIGWRWPARPLTAEEIMNKARREYEHHQTLEALKKSEDWLKEMHNRDAPALQAAIERAEREHAAKGLPPDPEPPDTVSPEERIFWTLHYVKFLQWKQEEEAKASKAVSNETKETTTEEHSGIQQNQVTEEEIKAPDDEDLDPEY